MPYDSKRKKTMEEQVLEKLRSMQAFGESKTMDKQYGSIDRKIYSVNTYKTYLKQCTYYAKWIQKTHPECTTMKKGRKYVQEYLKEKDNDPNISAYTVQLQAKALGKFYNIKPEDPDFYHPRKRRRVDIKRSRGEAVRDRNFSEKNNAELVNFCKGTGLRRSEIEALTGKQMASRGQLEEYIRNTPESGLSAREEKKLQSAKDVLEQFPTQDYFVFVESGKGGRARYSPIIGEHKQEIVDRILKTPEKQKVWQYVSSNADIHSYRSVYCTTIYKEYARDIRDIPYDKITKDGRKYQGDVYTCRADEKGKKLDRKAMLKASKALGHNRVSVVADNYIRGL